VPLILSGGLNAENVVDAIAQAGPFAVDSASGTESAPGKKDEQKLRAFFAAVEGYSSEEEDEGIAAQDASAEGAAA
jgi:phosphoribosylanthranilate isomerase